MWIENVCYTDHTCTTDSLAVSQTVSVAPLYCIPRQIFQFIHADTRKCHEIHADTGIDTCRYKFTNRYRSDTERYIQIHANLYAVNIRSQNPVCVMYVHVWVINSTFKRVIHTTYRHIFQSILVCMSMYLHVFGTFFVYVCVCMRMYVVHIFWVCVILHVFACIFCRQKC